MNLNKSFIILDVFIAISYIVEKDLVFSYADLKNKIPNNDFGIYSLYCDKSNWFHGAMNFWAAINQGRMIFWMWNR